MVATARRLAGMPISVIAALRPTAAALRSGNTVALEPSQRLGAVGLGSRILGNQVAPVNRNFVTVQLLTIDAKKPKQGFRFQMVALARPRQ